MWRDYHNVNSLSHIKSMASSNKIFLLGATSSNCGNILNIIYNTKPYIKMVAKDNYFRYSKNL